MTAPNSNSVDMDALLDFTDYDNHSTYQSPSLSPAGSSKQTYASPVTAPVVTPTVPSSTSLSQTLSGPSHNYDLYRQQTGFVPGALANTMAVNQTNNTGYQEFGNLDFLVSPENDMFDFNTSPSQNTVVGSELEMDFDSPTETPLFPTINPSSIEQQASRLSPAAAVPSTTNVGRLWPGAHSQAAMKAQAQQRQQQQLMRQQQQSQQQQAQCQQAAAAQQQPKARSGKAPMPQDPIVEQKITQLLNSMRAKPSSPDGSQASLALTRLRKEEEEMDEDERLLASEEGKKLSSKERRQLRNKVSARNFRSRRKEYITHLESQITARVNENGELRSQNKALAEENKRLGDLTRMLLSSSAFSDFVNTMQLDAMAAPAPTPQVKTETQPQQQQQQQSERSMPKDVNPYASQYSQQQQIGMAMIPEQSVDFSMMGISDDFSYQPQVFVVDTPEMPMPIDASVLSGKTSNLVETIEPVDNTTSDKVEMPTIEHPAEKPAAVETASVVDEAFESDPEFALYHNEPATSAAKPREIDTDTFSQVDIFGGIETEKVLARFELADATEEQTCAALAMARVQTISASIESVTARLEILTMDL